jgi:pyruvate-formate lyase
MRWQMVKRGARFQVVKYLLTGFAGSVENDHQAQVVPECMTSIDPVQTGERQIADAY